MKDGTQKALILKYIAENGYITSMSAYKLGITQLATRISELKDMGYTFETEDVKYKDKNGQHNHYFKYYLIDKVS